MLCIVQISERHPDMAETSDVTFLIGHFTSKSLFNDGKSQSTDDIGI
jgi:hypothetical protein